LVGRGIVILKAFLLQVMDPVYHIHVGLTN
jgi:hypothetical protein